jgi:hypothetical protein
MKHILTVTCMLVIFFTAGCSKSKDTAQVAPPADGTFDLSKATLLKMGSFSGNMNYVVEGAAKLYDFGGKKYIYFENFKTAAGPDLKVYVATTNGATQFINLGPLKGNTGVQVYLVNNPPDFNQYNKILIWCQQYSVLFGAAGIQ